MKIKIIALVLLAAMSLILFTGCGGSTNSTTTALDTAAAGTGTSAETTAAGEPVTIKIFTFSFGDASDSAAVAEEINKITIPKINTKVELNFINFGAWSDQANLMLSSGEQVDLMNNGLLPIANLAANGQIQPLDDLVAQYGQGIVSALGETYVNAGKVDGKLYGITNNRDLAASSGFVCRADILAKYNLSLDKVKTMADLEPILETVKAGEKDMYMVAPQAAPIMISYDIAVDNVGDTNNLGVLLNNGLDKTFKNYYESEFFINWSKTMYDWNQKGLIVPDILSLTETGDALMKAGKTFGYFTSLKPGFDTQTKMQTGMDVKVATLYPAKTSTGNASALCWVVPTGAKYPQQAVQFMNLWNTDPAVSNLLIYGIEGKHYKVVDQAANIIDYADGVDGSSIKYPVSMGWNIGNQFISHIWKGNSADYWKQMDEFNKTAIVSTAMGFSFDSSKVSTEYAACASVVAQYRNALMCGSLDPATGIPEFNKALKAAGIDKIITEKQAQFDAWQKTK